MLHYDRQQPIRFRLTRFQFFLFLWSSAILVFDLADKFSGSWTVSNFVECLLNSPSYFVLAAGPTLSALLGLVAGAIFLRRPRMSLWLATAAAALHSAIPFAQSLNPIDGPGPNVPRELLQASPLPLALLIFKLFLTASKRSPLATISLPIIQKR